ncbi:MAG TPA: dTDP-glucose 4,6-dehydratase, partial [Polyangiaceae bacterium]|nr:dTDP-glucose 4,6-dehydratase [Polyangiaceae bacterium]
VTGGAGFIGSAFVRHVLGAAFDGSVTTLDALTYAGNMANLAELAHDARHRFVHGDIRDAELVRRTVEEHAVDAIVHFAAESHVDRSILGPEAFVETNVVGTFRLLEAARRRPGVHFHHVSTDEVFGSLGAEGSFGEDAPYRPSSPYAATKAASDHLVRAYAHTYGTSVTLSNSGNNYGPRQFPEKLVPFAILNLFEGKPVPVYGDGLNVRDWLHVDDHVEAVWTIVRRGRAGETYNVGGEGERTNLEVIRLLVASVAAETGGSEAELAELVRFVTDRPGHDRRYAVESDKLRRELGWKPKHDLASGLADTVRWYRSNPEWVESVRTGAYRAWLETNYAGR